MQKFMHLNADTSCINEN